MIDLTPLDVRKKRGDFKKVLRGFDPVEVDGFLELVSERMEELVKANLTLEERAQRLGDQVVSLGGRERAVNEALVTAQQLRDEIRTQAQRESEQIRRDAEREVSQLRIEAERNAEHIAKEARHKAKELGADAERLLEERKQALNEIEAQRLRFLESYRHMLLRQMDLVQVEENRSPLEEVAVELDLGGGWDREGGGRADRRPFVAATIEQPAAPPAGAATPPPADSEVPTPPADPVIEDTVVEVVEVAEDRGSETAISATMIETVVGRAGTMNGGADPTEADDEEAMPVEGLAPSSDEMEHEATILPDPRAKAHALSRHAAEAVEEGVPALRKLLEEMGES